jgi:hypothetical protein
MPAQVGSLHWDNDEVPDSWLDDRLTAWALIALNGLVWLNGVNGFAVMACKLGKKVRLISTLCVGHGWMVERIGASLFCLRHCG